MADVEVALVVESLVLKTNLEPVEVAEARLEIKSWLAVAPDEVLTISAVAAGSAVPTPRRPFLTVKSLVI